MWSIKLTKEQKSALKEYVDKEVVVGIRPEYMHLKSEYTSDKEISEVSLKVKETELIGHEFIIYFDVNGNKLSAKASSEAKIKNNEEYDFVIESDKLHIFDNDSTLTII